MSTFVHNKIPAFLCMIITTVLFAVNASAQSMDTAYVPFKVNVDATAKAYLNGAKEAEKFIRAGNYRDTLRIISEGPTLASSAKASRPVIMHSSRGKISLELSRQLYKNADIALYSLNGKQILHSKATSISHPNVVMGVYLLSVKGINGNTFTTRLIHSGGGMNINVAFANENSSSTSLMEKPIPGNWTIIVSAEGYNDTSYAFTPETGNNPEQNITLRQAVPGFEPEMLGLVPGATIAELRFTWYSDEGSANNKTFVQIFDANGSLVKEAEGISGKASTGKLYHKAAITDLTPNTQYKYSVSNNGTDWSNKYNYKTPKSAAFKFAATGDQHQISAPRVITIEGSSYTITDNAIEMWGQTLGKIATHNVDFIAGVGDQVDSAKVEKGYTNFFAPPQMKNIPYAAAMGNHDIDSIFFCHFNLPNHTARNALFDFSGGKTVINGNYWYLYNNVLFVVLNTAFFYPNDLPGAQSSIERFDAVFTSAKAANIGKYDWIIVQHHESTRSVGSHAEDKEVLLNKEAGFETLMDKHGADIVLAGHDHVYVRTKPMKGGKAATDGKGAIYITLTAAASPKFYPIVTKLDDKSIMEKTLQNNRRGFAIFDVNGTSISFKAYDAERDVIVDSLSLSK